MAKFMREKRLGGFAEVPGGKNDPDCSHVLLEMREYDQLLRKISAAEQDARIAKYEAEKEITSAKQDAAQKVYQTSQKAQMQIEQIQKELVDERAECAHQRELNANLLRISKERANAERGLKPKKERTGYVVVHSEEKEYSFRDGRKRVYKVKLWETIIQSPYSVEFAEDVVRKQLEEEMFPENGKWLVGRIGITGKYNGNYEKMSEDKENNSEDSFFAGNVVVAQQQRLKRNFRSQYWEVAIVHTKPLGDIPEDLMPTSKKPAHGA